MGSIPCLGTKMQHAEKCVMAERPKKKKKTLLLNALKLLVHLSPPQTCEFWKKKLDFDLSLVSRIMSNTIGTKSLMNESI